ncbi:MAG: M20/M25/M40 family metallo-hydrolase [bacterium]|nr:M20/M25/M40 family metallo-hydrolase [bacterium]
MRATEKSGLVQDVVTLTEMIAPTGYEAPVQAWLDERWSAAGAKVRHSRIGNLYAHVGGAGPKLAIAAHADEISWRVKSIHADGFLWLTPGAGGSELNPPYASYLAQPCVVVTPKGHVPGVVGAATGHVATKAQREANRIDWGDVFLDIGARSREEAVRWGVHAGAPVVPNVPTRRVGANLVGKAMDDRAALAVMTQLLERVDRTRLAYDLWLVSTVQEEIGLVGASSVEGFDLAIALEVGLAGDIPTVGLDYVPARLGGGPILGHKDALVAYDVALTRRLQAVAEAAGIPVQHLVFHSFGSDGKAFMANDVPSALLAYPTRYTHSPIESVDEGDLEAMVRLLEAFVTQPAEPSGRTG